MPPPIERCFAWGFPVDLSNRPDDNCKYRTRKPRTLDLRIKCVRHRGYDLLGAALGFAVMRSGRLCANPKGQLWYSFDPANTTSLPAKQALLKPLENRTTCQGRHAGQNELFSPAGLFDLRHRSHRHFVPTTGIFGVQLFQ